MSTASLKVRTTYKFQIYPAVIFGTDTESGCTVMAVLDPESAAREVDIYSRHVQAYAYLPENAAEDDATSYDYAKVKLASGSTMIIGLPWINTSTLEEVTAQTITVTIPNTVASDVSIVKNALSLNGYSDFSVTIA